MTERSLDVAVEVLNEVLDFLIDNTNNKVSVKIIISRSSAVIAGQFGVKNVFKEKYENRI